MDLPKREKLLIRILKQCGLLKDEAVAIAFTTHNSPDAQWDLLDWFQDCLEHDGKLPTREQVLKMVNLIEKAA